MTHLPRLSLTKQSSKIGPAFYSDEVRRVLSMGIPVAVVVKLPSFGGGIFQPNHTNLLLYFPHMYTVQIYEYTLRQGRANYKFIGQYGDKDYSLEELPNSYKYTVELTPFLIAHGDSRNEGDTIFGFFIQCANVGSKILELKLLYRDEDRQDEWLDLYWRKDDSHHAEGELVARWLPFEHIDKTNNSNSYLIWKTGEGKELKDDETVPHIRGYHYEEEDDIYED